MNVYDFHAHIYPEKIATRAVEAIGHFYNIEMDGHGTAETLLELSEETPINKHIVHSVATIPKQVASINDFIKAQCEKYPQFVGFGTIHPDLENGVEEVTRIKSMGLHGIKIHPDTQKFKINSKDMDEIYEAAQELGLPVLIHCGDYRYDYSHPSRLKKMLAKFPKLCVIGAHFGGWSMPDLAYEFLKDENCFMDTSSSFSTMGLLRAKELINLYGADRFVFGSDFPMWSPKDEFEKFMSIGLKEDEIEKILTKNPERILGIK